MKAARSFVFVVVGTLPDDVLPGAAAQSLIPLFSHSFVIGPHLKGSALRVSAEPPIEMLKRLADSVIEPKVELT